MDTQAGLTVNGIQQTTLVTTSRSRHSLHARQNIQSAISLTEMPLLVGFGASLLASSNAADEMGKITI
jgi:hypothetical protein